VLGSPVGHSLSPVLHQAAYRALGLQDWSYTAIETDEAALPGMLDRLRTQPGWAGVSLTMPLKTAAVPLVDRVDEAVTLVGALNTIVVEPGGALVGYNTDIAGIRHAILRVLRSRAGGEQRPPAPVRALVLGAGGTARAAIAALAAVGVRRVGAVARRAAAVAPLAEIGERFGLEVVTLPWETVADGLRHEVDLVVATTPAGVTDQLAKRPWPAGSPLVELLYHPWPTPLAAAAYRAGARVAGGLDVLAAQAAGQVALVTGREVDVDLLLAAGTRDLARRAAEEAPTPSQG
jgi:shikimate dehydrogenase